MGNQPALQTKVLIRLNSNVLEVVPFLEFRILGKRFSAHAATLNNVCL